MLDLSAVFCRPTLHRTFISTIPCGEDTSRDDCLDVLLSRYQGLYVICDVFMLELPGHVLPVSLTGPELQKRVQPLDSSG
jgi:hypothetical protein